VALGQRETSGQVRPADLAASSSIPGRVFIEARFFRSPSVNLARESWRCPTARPGLDGQVVRRGRGRAGGSAVFG